MIILFTVCSLINVVLNTVKTIVMHKEEKLSSSLVNSLTFAFYTVLIILMNCDMALWLKVLITAVTNFIGVWGSMVVMEKLRKDKLWEVRATVKSNKIDKIEEALTAVAIPYTATITNDEAHYIVNIYCETQKDSEAVKTILNKNEAKYFVSESKTL